VGVQVPPRDQAAFSAFLAKLGYPYSDETRNAAYKLFLA
jgi:threonine dehydratase